MDTTAHCVLFVYFFARAHYTPLSSIAIITCAFPSTVGTSFV